MAKLGIAGTKVVRWMRKYDQDGSFIAYRDYPELALCTVSTHDSETLALWWQNFPEEAKEFSKFSNIAYEPILTKANRAKILQDSHSACSIFHINLLSEYLALFDELVSPRLEDERINIPGKILDTNWTYKIKISLEELSNHEPLKQAIRSILPKK